MPTVNNCFRTVVGLTLCLLITACASLRSEDRIRAEVREAKFSRSGDVVQLYYQMGASSKEQFCPGAVLTVYRRSTDRIGEMYYSKMEVGKIKVTRNLSGRYVEATVLEGNLWPGDLAMQSSTTCYSTTAQLP